MPRAVHLAVPLLAKSLAASLSPVAAAEASRYSGPAGLAQSNKRQEGLRGGWEGRRAAQQAQEREDVRKEWRGSTLAAPSSPWAGTRGGQTGRLTASAGLWVWDTARAGTRGTCCWWSPWTVSGGWAQLHPSAASCPPLSGVKFQPRRHRILGWGPSTPRPAPPFRAHLAIPPSGIWSPWLY